jgi:hypothetical protein
MTQMKTQTLEYYLHDEWDALRFELAGSLSGDGAQSVYQAWRTALSIVGDRPVIFDITFVVEADERGRAILLLWHQNGARIIAASSESRALAEPILGEALPPPPAKQGWLHRLSALYTAASHRLYRNLGRSRTLLLLCGIGTTQK